MTNVDLKYYRGLKEKKFKVSRKKFLIEGIHLVEECIKSKFYSGNIERVFLRKDFNGKRLLKLIENSLPDIEITTLDDKEFHSLTETVNPQGIIAVVSSEQNNMNKESENSETLVIALDCINDPGNAGTILRTAHWFGVDKVILSSDSVDLFNSKVIRASQGAIFNILTEQDVNLENELKNYSDKSYNVYLSDINSDKYLSEVEFNKKGKLIFVLGNEANGISQNILNESNYDRIKIKGYSEGESLNVAVAAGIILYAIKSKK